MYLTDKERELTITEIQNIISSFKVKELPKLIKWREYYDGKQAILKKQATDTGKPENKVIVNYCHNIVNNYNGYITGIPITYENEDFDTVKDVLNYNDVQTTDKDLLKNALIYGIAFEINYIDELGYPRFKVLDSRECIPVYDNTLTNELQYVIRFWEEDLVEDLGMGQIKRTPQYNVEVYGPQTVKKYVMDLSGTLVTLLEEEQHFYDQCPFSILTLDDEVSVFNQVMSLQDAYNQLLSGEVDDFDAFADAYLILKGVTADEEDMRTMKQNRVLMMDSDADARYLTKSIGDTQIENMLTNINNQIHKIASSPDFTDEAFMSQSGVAIRYKLIAFENQASNMEANMKKALQKRIELISAILGLYSGDKVWRDTTFKFTRNLPLSIDANNMTIADINGLRGLVSNKTLLTLLPFVSNVDEELDRLSQEKQVSLYSFGNNNEVLE